MVFGRMNPFGRSSQGESEAEDTQPEEKARDVDETAASSASERPGIADKVRFWEEQDRINRELIPRVLKQNELLSAHVASHEEVRVQTASLSSRIDELAERHAKAIADIEARTAAEIRSSTRRALFVSVASAGIAALAVVLALVG